MDSEPAIKILPYKSRQRFFKVLLVLFIILFPTFIFYTSGYRLNFDDDAPTMIVTTGGMYITTENLDVDVYLNSEQVQRPRLFRSAYYIQNIEAGLHRVIVQQPGLHTWVKILPVDPYIVIEASAFNFPVLPQIRPIPEFTTSTGTGVFIVQSTSTELFPKATTTETFVLQTSRATSNLLANGEYLFVENLFSQSTNTATTTLINRIENQIERFQFSTTSTPVATTTEEYIERGGVRIIKRDNEFYAKWIGSANSFPYYYCLYDAASSTIAARYGEHVAAQVELQRLSTSTPLVIENNRVCRPEIKLDRKRQLVNYYNFLPNSTDLVVFQLEDGLYVTEVDDRAWQNTQLIYPGADFSVQVTDDAIYILEAGRIFELLTELPE